MVGIENNWIQTAVRAALAGGQAIMTVYQRDFTTQYKEDRSPLTEADQLAHETIVEHLAQTGLPVLSEESKAEAYATRQSWSQFWLVDPLDGTKEFIKRNGEFTVNIALIQAGRPVLGVVFAPVLHCIYVGVQGAGAYRATGEVLTDALRLSPDEFFQKLKTLEAIPVGVDRPGQPAVMRIVASRSHMNPETESFIAELEKTGPVELVSSGSSLKLCMVADGSADVYPRIAPTMEWDTAAAQAVVEASGGTVMQYGTNHPVIYNKENLLNPFFVVYGKGYERKRVL
ncbi:MAG: 3'(2'),5'-bisphosphate nucleotidase CysQ [Kiritimatiellaceae bacterium]|nr:3'(2'),5'-bisphosphate nucleotidase CysQ [Kiritimatiellaceae bacterium]